LSLTEPIRSTFSTTAPWPTVISACDVIQHEAFISKHYAPDVAAAYRMLQIGAAKADLWRILVLSTYGGVYLDADAAFSWPPDRFLSADQNELFVRERDGRLTNYFLAAVPGHPLFVTIAKKIVENVQANTLTSVYDMTGPTVVDALVDAGPYNVEPSRYVCRQGQFTKKVFQYPEQLKGYWAREQEKRPIVEAR
jgi:mannosyltransferase OCH1-like enzyme